MYDADHPASPTDPFDTGDASPVIPTQLTPLADPSDRRQSRRRKALFGLGAVGFCAAGLLVGSQLAGAGGSNAAAPAAGTEDAVSSTEAASPWGAWPTDTEHRAVGGGWSSGGWFGPGGMAGMMGMGPLRAGFDGAVECMATDLGVDISGGMGPETLKQLKDIPQEQIREAWETCAAELPAELTQRIDQFRACFGDRVPGPLASGVLLGPMGAVFDGHGAVAVLTPEEHAVHSFGEGDGSITVTKTGDGYTVTTTGEVTETEVGAMLEGMGSKLQELVPELRDRLQECGIEPPTGAGAPAGS